MQREKLSGEIAEGKRGGKLSRENVGGKIITLFPREWRRKISGEIVAGKYGGKIWGLG